MRIVDWAGFKVYEDNIPQNKSGVYVFLNLVNGKYYVGESVELRARIRAHAAGTSPRKFRNALAKYGAHNFLVMPVWYAITQEPDKSFQLSVETAIIIELDAIKNGYNLITDYTRKNWGWSDPDNPPDRSWHSEFFRNLWNDPVIEAKMRAIAADPEFQARRGKAIKASFDKPGGKDKLIAAINEPEARKRKITKLKEYYASDEARQRASDLQAGVADKHSQSLVDAWEKRPRMWITDGNTNKQHFVDLPIPEGWVRGRSGLLGRALAKSRSNSME